MKINFLNLKSTFLYQTFAALIYQQRSQKMFQYPLVYSCQCRSRILTFPLLTILYTFEMHYFVHVFAAGLPFEVLRCIPLG